MGRDYRNTRQGGTQENSGSYTPSALETPEGIQTRKFVMKEKIGEMLKYGIPLVNSFPRRDRQTADLMRGAMLEMFRLATRLERKYYKKTTLEDLDVELAVLKEFILIASDRDYSGPKQAPPLTLHQREVWSRHTTEIGRMIGGYKKAIEAARPKS